MNKEKLNILVTGAAGFVGSNLCRSLLNCGHNVIGLDNMSVGFKENMIDFIDNDNYKFYKLDIRELDLNTNIDMFYIFRSIVYDKIDVIFHLAARGELYFCRESPEQAIDNNVIGTLKVLDLARACKVKHFIFSDTSAEYDNVKSEDYPVVETSAPNLRSPKGIYSISKMCAAQLVRHSGISNAIVRYFNVYGPSMNVYRDIPPVIGSMTKSIIEGKNPIIYGDGSKRRDFIDIRDVTDLHLKMIDNRTNGTFNVGTGENYSIYEIYGLVCREFFGENYDMWPNIDYKPDQPNEADITLADISHTRRTFDWTPKIAIEQGVRHTINYLKDVL